MRQRYALDFGPRARKGERCCVSISKHILRRTGTLLQRYDLTGVSVKVIDKKIINVYFGVRMNKFSLLQ
jgi:hypothetical protein